MWPMSLNLRWQDFKLCVDIKKLGINLLCEKQQNMPEEGFILNKLKHWIEAKKRF